MKCATLPFVVCVLLAWVPGCNEDEEGSCEPTPYYHPVIDPGNFAQGVDNPYMPLIPGSTFKFKGGDETIDIEVTTDSKKVMGMDVVVVRDTVREEGEITEDTFDWFAQDLDGNVWYMGEDSKEYEDGKPVSSEGSWEADVDGALPGYLMLAEPRVGLAYRQEYYACEAEDMAEIVSVNQTVEVPAGKFEDCIEFHEWSALEEGSDESKYFCRGVGVVLEIDDEGVRVELMEYNIPTT